MRGQGETEKECTPSESSDCSHTQLLLIGDARAVDGVRHDEETCLPGCFACGYVAKTHLPRQKKNKQVIYLGKETNLKKTEFI